MRFAAYNLMLVPGILQWSAGVQGTMHAKAAEKFTNIDSVGRCQGGQAVISTEGETAIDVQASGQPAGVFTTTAKLGTGERQVNYIEFSGLLTAARGTPGESWCGRPSAKMRAATSQTWSQSQLEATFCVRGIEASAGTCSEEPKMGAAERHVNFTEFYGMLTAAPGTPGESYCSRCEDDEEPKGGRQNHRDAFEVRWPPRGCQSWNSRECQAEQLEEHFSQRDERRCWQSHLQATAFRQHSGVY